MNASKTAAREATTQQQKADFKGRALTESPAIRKVDGKLNWRLVDAIRDGKWAEAGDLIEKGADPNSRNAWGFPVMITIASAGPTWLLEMAIANGADAEIRSPINDWTPALAASAAKRLDALKVLEKAAISARTIRENQGC